LQTKQLKLTVFCSARGKISGICEQNSLNWP
jgi:hypothetical protein